MRPFGADCLLADSVDIKKALKRFFPGVAWQHPMGAMILRLIDPLDYAVRYCRGLAYLPRYSVRVRSNGMAQQFGGGKFYRLGVELATLLRKFASIQDKSRALEIGCGCGRVAFALAASSYEKQYTGVDIDTLSIRSCRENQVFLRKAFQFDTLDVRNREYNPSGSVSASDFRFPYGAEEFGVIFLVSVFTHMLTNDVRNYIREISRMLEPGGICMFTTFLMGDSCPAGSVSFPRRDQEHFYFDTEIPEVAVGYLPEFFVDEFATCGLQQLRATVWGSWRDRGQAVSHFEFRQDVMFFAKI